MERKPVPTAASFCAVAALVMFLSGCVTKPRPPLQPEMFSVAGIDTIRNELKDAIEQEPKQSKIAVQWVQAKNKKEACLVFRYVLGPSKALDDNQKMLSNASEHDELNRVYWEGDCQNGYASGIGRMFTTNRKNWWFALTHAYTPYSGKGPAIPPVVLQGAAKGDQFQWAMAGLKVDSDGVRTKPFAGKWDIQWRRVDVFDREKGVSFGRQKGVEVSFFNENGPRYKKIRTSRERTNTDTDHPQTRLSKRYGKSYFETTLYHDPAHPVLVDMVLYHQKFVVGVVRQRNGGMQIGQKFGPVLVPFSKDFNADPLLKLLSDEYTDTRVHVEAAEQQVGKNERKLAIYHDHRCSGLDRESIKKQFPGIPIELITNGCSFHALVGGPETPPIPNADIATKDQ